MSKKVIIALLAIMIACCICCAAAAFVSYFLYSEDVFANTTYEQSQIQSYESESLAEIIPQNTLIPTEKIQPTIDGRLEYMADLQDDLFLCAGLIEAWGEINDIFAEDHSLLYDEASLEEYTAVLTQMKENCTSFGVEENPPSEYKEINDNALLVNESMAIFVDSCLLYFDTKDNDDELIAIDAAFEMQDNIEQLANSIIEIANQE